MNGVLFHSKSAFLRVGDQERFPLQVTIGLEMNNLFGGTRYNVLAGTETQFPSNAAAFWTALFPFHELEQQGNEDGDNLGSWHLDFDYKLNDWNIGAYYEHFYEDHSSLMHRWHLCHQAYYRDEGRRGLLLQFPAPVLSFLFLLPF